MSRFKNKLLNLSLKKIYAQLFINNFKKDSYFNFLKNLYYEFLSTKHPQLEKKNFEKTLHNLISFDDSLLDNQESLYKLFEPNYADNLDNYYRLFEKQTFYKFLKYSINTKLIKSKYSDVYEFGIKRLNSHLDILEIGGGVPHGLIYNIWEKGNKFCKSFTYVEANMLHTEFVDWYCKKYSINIDKRIFLAAKTPAIKNIKFNFVFAKDIFEHLDDPSKLIDDLIVFSKNQNTLLCLDLEHKGGVTLHHLNPNLPILKKKLLDNNFRVVKKFKEIHVWENVS